MGACRERGDESGGSKAPGCPGHADRQSHGPNGAVVMPTSRRALGVLGRTRPREPRMWTEDWGGPTRAGTEPSQGAREPEKGTAPVGGTTGAVDAPGPGGERPVRRSLRPLRGASGSILGHNEWLTQHQEARSAPLRKGTRIPEVDLKATIDS